MNVVLEHKKAGFWKTLSIRLVSVLMLLPIILTAMWVGGTYFQVIILAIAGFVSYEWFNIITQYQPIEKKLIRSIAFFQSVSFSSALFFYTSGFNIISLVFALIFILAVLLISKRASISLLSWWLIGAFVIAVPSCAVLRIRDIPDFGREGIFFLFIVVWMTDSFAYLGGNLIKGPKLAPKISPGKTWSGSIIGILAGCTVGALAPLTFGVDHMGQISSRFIFLGAALAVACQISDLAESWLKRRFGVKDSGSLIPGHGGFLDRVDSLFLSAPLMLFILLLFGLGFWTLAVS